MEFVHHCLVDRVTDLWTVQQNSEPVFAFLDEKCGEVFRIQCHYTPSSSIAVPCPTPMHMVANPSLGPEDEASSPSMRPSSVIAIREPLEPNGCPQTDGTAVVVHDVRVQPKATHARQRLRSESLIEFHGAQLIHREAGPCQDLLGGGGDRADAHDFRFASCRGAVDDAGAGRQAELFDGGLRSNDDGRGAVVERG